MGTVEMLLLLNFDYETKINPVEPEQTALCLKPKREAVTVKLAALLKRNFPY